MAPTQRPHFLDPYVIAQGRDDDNLPSPTKTEMQEYLRSLEACGCGKNGREYYLYQRREDALFARRLKASQAPGDGRRGNGRRGSGSPAARGGRASHSQARSAGTGGDSGGDGSGDPEPEPDPASHHLTPSRLSLSAARRADSAARWLAAHDKKSKGLQKEVTQENRARREQARCTALTHDNLTEASPWILPARPVCGLSPKRWAQLAQLAETKSERAVAPMLAEGARVVEIAERLHRTRRRIEQIAASLRKRAVELVQRIEARRGKPPLALKPARGKSLPLLERTVERATEQLVLFAEAA